jgi:hypothetical protein
MSTSHQTFSSTNWVYSSALFQQAQFESNAGSQVCTASFVTRRTWCWWRNQKPDLGVLTAVLLRIHVFWDVMPCLPVNSSRRFERPLCLHIQGHAVQEKFLNFQIHHFLWIPKNNCCTCYSRHVGPVLCQTEPLHRVFISLFIYLFPYLFISLFPYLFTYLFIFLFTYLFISLCISLFVYLFISLFISFLISLFIYFLNYLLISLFIYLFMGVCTATGYRLDGPGFESR